MCRPTCYGGLGIFDLRFFGFALRLRWEWLNCSAPDSCWTTLPSRIDSTVTAMAAVSMSVVLGNGCACKLWTDSWSQVGPLCRFAPDLFAAISRTGKKSSVRDGICQNPWARDIVGAPTTQVLCQYLLVWRILRDVMLIWTQADRLVWKWSPDGKYSASSSYRAFFNGCTSLLGAAELWRTKAPPKVKFFFWLVLYRRLWTAEHCKRHGLQDDDACALCGPEPEIGEHLFLGCIVARELWFRLLAPVGLDALVPEHRDDITTWWLGQHLRIDFAAKPAFDTLMLLLCWSIWKEQNNL